MPAQNFLYILQKNDLRLKNDQVASLQTVCVAQRIDILLYTPVSS